MTVPFKITSTLVQSEKMIIPKAIYKPYYEKKKIICHKNLVLYFELHIDNYKNVYLPAFQFLRYSVKNNYDK